MFEDLMLCGVLSSLHWRSAQKQLTVGFHPSSTFHSAWHFCCSGTSDMASPPVQKLNRLWHRPTEDWEWQLLLIWLYSMRKKGKTILNILKCDCQCKDYWHLIENLLVPAIFSLTFSIALSLNLTILTCKATTANCLWLNRRVGHLLVHNVSESKHICPAASMYGHLWKLDSECLFVWGSMAQSGHSVDRSHAWGVVFICLCRDATAACGASPSDTVSFNSPDACVKFAWKESLFCSSWSALNMARNSNLYFSGKV